MNQSEATPSPATMVGSDGLRFPAESEAVVDVLFDGRRVWSVAPKSYSLDGGGLRLVPWPVKLQPYLKGATRVTVREHLTQRVLLDREHSFDATSGRVSVEDAAGRPLAIGKAGLLQPPFEVGGTEMISSLLDHVSQVLGVLRDECGLPSFISYGALLGAVRDGKLIGHDNDVDVAYLSTHAHPMDVVRESFRIERAFHQQGFRYRRFAAGDFKVMVTDADGTTRGIDVFGGFLIEDYLHLMPYVRARLPREVILPLSEVELEGRRFPAPRDSPALLEATYGPEWRDPDPSFRFRPPPATRRRLVGWMRGLRMHRDYWDKFYRDRSTSVPREPSPFARWVAERATGQAPIVEIGSGTGRDALWFARSGYEVFGLDYAVPAITFTQKVADAENVPATFTTFDLYDLRHVLSMGAHLSKAREPWNIYGRFLVHALEDEGRHNLWRLAEMSLRAGGRCYLEFRTGKDSHATHEFGEHFRRFLDSSLVVDEIEARGGNIEYQKEGFGLAPYKSEDPHVCRLVVRWQGEQ